jgi:hypothetical protein
VELDAKVLVVVDAAVEKAGLSVVADADRGAPALCQLEVLVEDLAVLEDKAGAWMRLESAADEPRARVVLNGHRTKARFRILLRCSSRFGERTARIASRISLQMGSDRGLRRIDVSSPMAGCITPCLWGAQREGCVDDRI